MEKIALENIPRNICFTRIYGLNQVWNNKNNWSWSCIGTPRDQHGFLYIFCDEVHITNTDGKCSDFHKGDLLYIPKGSEYDITFSPTKSSLSTILINFNIQDTNCVEYALADEITCFAQDIPAKITDAMLTVAHLSTNLAHPTIPVTKAFYEMLEKLTNHLLASKLHGSDKDSVLPAIFYLDSHVLDNVSIPQLAQMCLLNESAFRKAFKAYTGMNPAQYKMHSKINKAKLLLRSTTEIPIEEIADGLGFYDNAYFHKVFAKTTGMTPKQYRDKHIKK